MRNVNITLLTGLLLFAVLPSPAAYGQEAEKPSSFTVKMGKDNFFGFYPTFLGTVGIRDKVDFTYYGIFWTIPAFGTAPTNGQGLWTEFGVGLRFNLLDNQLTINPQIGTLHGKLLSGSTRAVIFDGIVPSLTANLLTDHWESELYLGLYTGLNRTNASTTNYAHYWLNGGYRFNKTFSAGLHGEVLAVSGGTLRNGDVTADVEASGVYQWVGPYAQFTVKNTTTRFSFGNNFLTAGFADPSFYKLAVGYSF